MHSKVKHYYTLTGDLFKDPLPKADIYSICHVLIAYDDDKCDMILKKVSDSLKPGKFI